MLEVELKGVCEPYDVVIEPSVLLIPGQILQDTATRHKFKVATHSHVFCELNAWLCSSRKFQICKSCIYMRGLLCVS